MFEQWRFNDKHPEKTSDPNNSVLFDDTHSSSLSLPTLGLTRVFVLTGPTTCSGSESVINSLNPFVNVLTIGGTAYFAIEFDGVNSAGQGGYVNGLAPACAAADDLEHQFGDSNARLLQTALTYQSSGACPASAMAQAATGRSAAQAVQEIYRAPWRASRLLTSP